MTPKTLYLHYNLRKSSLHLFRILVCALAMIALCTVAWAQDTNKSGRLISNKKRYSDRGLRPATGRSGSASLTVRALLGKDGKTSLEATTGALDSETPPPGTIRKVQLKPLNQDGEALFAQNYVGLNSGGYFSKELNYLHHLQQIQVQANTDGIDAKRTNVITVVETVKKRPDLAVSNLTPSTGVIGSPVIISATVKELNGDVGAQTNCVLYIDGVEADRSSFVWVDANGAVSIAFLKVFQTPGSRSVEIKLLDVNPGDYDGANNSVSGSLSIVQPVDTLNYDAYLNDEEVTFTQKEEYEIGSTDPLYGWKQAYGNESSISSSTQSVQLIGSAPHYSSFPYTLAVTETSDGTNVLSASVNIPSGGSSNFGDPNFFYFQNTSGIGEDMSQNITVYVTNLKVTFQGQSLFEGTNVDYRRFGGTVTYHSQGYNTYWYLNNGVRVDVDNYSYNNDSTNTLGTRLAVGAQYSITLSLTSGDDPAQVFSAFPVMNVQAVASSYTSPRVCNQWTFEMDFGSNCEQSSGSIITKTGSATFNGAP